MTCRPQLTPPPIPFDQGCGDLIAEISIAKKIDRESIMATPGSKRKRTVELLHALTEAEQAEYDRNMAAKNASAKKRNAEARALIQSTIPKGALVTLESAIVTYNEFCAGKGTPLSAADSRQLEAWNVTQSSERNSDKTILIELADGMLSRSKRVSDMKSRGISAEMSAHREMERVVKCRKAHLGHEMRNVLEGCAIECLLDLFKRYVPSSFKQWIFQPVFDGLQADLMARHESFLPEMFVPIQIKSAQVQFGKMTSINLNKGQYEDWMYCIAVGLRDYTNNTTPYDFDDTHVEGVHVYEVFDLGLCVKLSPCPATSYGSIESSKRCFFMHDAPAFPAPAVFLANMLQNLKNWPHRFTRDRILYNVDGLSLKVTTQKHVEVRGLYALSRVLETRAPRRQNETVDSIVTIDGKDFGLSNKTASIANRRYEQRLFPISKHKFDHFCHWVIACYGDEDYKKVAVIPANVVYRCGKQNFCWNESNQDDMRLKQIALFDLRTQAVELRAHLKTGYAAARPEKLVCDQSGVGKSLLMESAQENV